MNTRAISRNLSHVISYAWNAASSVYGAMLIGASVLATAITIQTGQNFTLFVQSGLGDRDLTSVASLAICISFSLFLATFLIGYALNENKWGLGSWFLLVFFLTSFPSSTPLFVLAFVPLLTGVIASHFFNRYCRHSRIMASRLDRLSFILCRYGILVTCGVSLLPFITPSDVPFALIAVLWVVKFSLMLSGAFRMLWEQAPLALTAG